MKSKVGRLLDLQVQLWILVSQTASRQSHGSQEEEKGGGGKAFKYLCQNSQHFD
jgi:hypothetical protein